MYKRYFKWNDHIFNSFFNESVSGKSIALYVDADKIQEWANELGFGNLSTEAAIQLFVADVKEFLDGDQQKIAIKAANLCKTWKAENFTTVPKFIGLLSMLVLASSGTADTSDSKSYYRNYRKIMTGRDEGPNIPHMEELKNVWMTLNSWSYNLDSEKNIGYFDLITLSKSWVHIGIIVAQTILLPRDIQSLYDLFYEENADCDYEYSEQVIDSWILKRKNIFSPRVYRALSGDAKTILYIRVRDELRQWDGAPGTPPEIGANRIRDRKAWLVMKHDDSGVPVFNLRLNFEGRGGSSEIVFNKWFNFGRTKLFKADAEDGLLSSLVYCFEQQDLDSKNKDLSNQPFVIKDEVTLNGISKYSFESYSADEEKTPNEDKNIYKLSNRKLMVFVDGFKRYGDSEFVESERLTPGFEHIILINDFYEDAESAKIWANENSVPSSKSRLKDFLPEFIHADPLWNAFHIKSNAKQHKNIPALQYERLRFARLVGGVRVFGSGNRFIDSSPPRLRVDTDFEFEVHVNEQVKKFERGYMDFDLDSCFKPGVNHVRVINFEGDEVTFNITIITKSEWKNTGPGQHLTGSALSGDLSAVDCLGTFQGAYSRGYSEEVNPSWCIREGFLEPCVPSTTLARRVNIMEKNRQMPIVFSGKKNIQAWRNATKLSLHPCYLSDVKAVEQFNTFKNYA
jgi:hypothetical protein